MSSYYAPEPTPGESLDSLNQQKKLFWFILASLLLVSIVIGILVWNQSKNNTIIQSQKTSRISLNTSLSSSVASSSSITQSISTASTSSSSAPTNKKYTDSTYTNVSFEYDDTWILDEGMVDPAFQSKTITLNKRGNGSMIKIALDTAGRGISGFCLNNTQYVDIANGWTRLRADDKRYFNKTTNIDRTPPISSYEIGDSPECFAGSTASATPYIDIPDTAIANAYISYISLDLIGTDTAIADAIITTIRY